VVQVLPSFIRSTNATQLGYRMPLSCGFKLLICASSLVSVAVSKTGSTVRSEVKVEVDEKGVPHPLAAPKSDQKREDRQVEVNQHGDIVDLGIVGSAHEAQSSEANEKSKTTQEEDDDANDAALDEVEAEALSQPASNESESFLFRRRRSTTTDSPEPVDCEWDVWRDDTSVRGGRCSTTCGAGIKTQHRTENTLPKHGGQECVGERSRVVECNQDITCPPTTTTLSFTMPVKNGATGIVDSVPWFALVGSLTLSSILHIK